jgi:hypothetical protein
MQDTVLSVPRPHARKPSRNRFAPEPRARLRLNGRDLDVLAFLFDNSLASRSQIQELFYGSRAYCNTRLRSLFDHNLVLRHFPAVTLGGRFGEEAVYSVGPAAVPLLAERLEEPFEAVKAHIRRREAPLFVAHTLRTVDIYLHLRRDALPRDIEVERWVGEVRARHDYQWRDASGKWHNESFKPDGYLRLADPSTSSTCGHRSYFIECDMGHASSGQWKVKVAAHRRYLETGLFASTFGEQAFTTLVVTTGERRLDHLREATLDGGVAFFRFTTFAALDAHGAFGAIWNSPGDATRSPLF